MGIRIRIIKALQKVFRRNKNNSEALREEHQRLQSSYNQLFTQYQSLFNQTTNGCVILEAADHGTDFLIKAINPGAEKIEQKNKEKILGRNLTEVFPSSKTNGLLETFQRVHQTGISEELTIIMGGKEDVKHKHNNTINKLPDGTLMAVYNETKELEKSKQELQKSRERLKLTLESSNIGLWDHNLKTGEVYRSKEWAEMLGYTKEEIDKYSTDWKNLIHPEDLPLVEQIATEHENLQSDSFQVEHRLKTKDGNYKWILNWGKIIEFDDKGNPARAVGTHLDIDKRKKAEEKLAELNATKDQLFSIIGHDLKNPLSDILGFSSLLYKRYNQYSTEKQLEFIRIISKSARSMQDLLENLLNWSRLQREEVHFAPEKIHIDKLCYHLIDQFQTKAELKNIRLLQTIQTKTLAYADKNMIQTVLRNLISNAVKYTKQEGTVSVSAKETAEKIIISVEDTGIGIDQNNLNQLFKASNGSISRGTNNEKGTGFGLILCKEIINLHKEQIWVESEPGQGTTFSFSLQKTQQDE